MNQLEYTIKGYIKELLLEKPGMFHAMFNVLRYGFYPLTWRGPYPEGYCLAVHLPFDQPAPPIPPECQPTPEVLKKYDKPPKHPKPIAITALDVPALPASSWSDLIVRSRASGGTASVFREHFAVLAETDACRDVLDRIAAVVTGFRKDGKDLVVDFPGESFAMADAGEPDAPTISRFLRCPPPYTGAIAGLPPSCVAVIRRHNGITLHSGTADPNATNTDLGWHVYKKPRFRLESDVWFSPDEWDPDELFMTVPQVPIHGESDIWLLHPQRLRADNEPAVVCMSHDFGTLCNPAPYGAGGVFLRLLAHAVDAEGGAADLWDEGR
ncbi:hypothetical protein LBMAG53_23680 [Planctomycetota bacterium]|nr:hypothetical protein LBMAG53_23680 [Planctomycetota bacterium]